MLPLKSSKQFKLDVGLLLAKAKIIRMRGVQDQLYIKDYSNVYSDASGDYFLKTTTLFTFQLFRPLFCLKSHSKPYFYAFRNTKNFSGL